MPDSQSSAPRIRSPPTPRDLSQVSGKRRVNVHSDHDGRDAVAWQQLDSMRVKKTGPGVALWGCPGSRGPGSLVEVFTRLPL